jgi:hypothetical protein
MNDTLAAEQMIGREDDVAYVIKCVRDADCCSVVGISNIGKSTLLRSLSSPENQEKHLGGASHEYLFVHVDLNLVSQVTEQGFYEATLRNILQTLASRGEDEELRQMVQSGYKSVVGAGNPFMVPLAFEDSIQALCAGQPARLVLLFDEFDEVFSEVDSRVFVRLRALRDRLRERLSYVTATGRLLNDEQRDRATGEFCEMFAAHTRFLKPLSKRDSQSLVDAWARRTRTPMTPDDMSFVAEVAGGHPVLLETSARILTRMRQEASWHLTPSDYSHVRERLDGDPVVRIECAKLWNDLGASEQESLIALLDGQETAGVDTLVDKGIVQVTSAGKSVFSELLAGFAKRQQLVRRRGPQGIRIDVEAGDVWVDGKLAPLLTDLEYKLLLLLYGNLDRICDKYKIVESVWGENYIDEVDDARIEKLVSRLREKLEPNPVEPKYVMTVRGRGYKLVGPE